MRHPARSRILAPGLLAVALALFTGACTSAEEREVRAQLDDQAQRVEEQVGSEFDLSQEPTAEQIECLEELGLDDRALAAGVTDPAEGERVLGIFLRCIPDLEDFDPFLAGVVGSVELSFGNGLDLSPGEGRCLIGEIIDSAPDPARALANPTEADLVVFQDAALGCLGDEALDVFGGTSGFMSYGDDPGLDALYDRCDGGDDLACDLLFVRSAIGSEYEQLAEECAGRIPSDAGTCSPDIASVVFTGILDESDPGTQRLVATCEGGDLIACDLLYALAPTGSAIEQIGATCGGQLQIQAIPDCRTVVDG